MAPGRGPGPPRAQFFGLLPQLPQGVHRPRVIPMKETASDQAPFIALLLDLAFQTRDQRRPVDIVPRESAQWHEGVGDRVR